MNLVTIDGVKITFTTLEGDLFVPIKPICTILDIDHTSQLQGLKAHPIIGDSIQLLYAMSADNKKYKMSCIPVKYVFAWICMIDPRKVKPEASESLLKKQHIVFDAFHEMFYKKNNLQKAFVVNTLKE